MSPYWELRVPKVGIKWSMMGHLLMDLVGINFENVLSFLK